ncbi:MAG: hypothetical protein V3S65_03880 [Candidatus Aminicenantaceae bacterium]
MFNIRAKQHENPPSFLTVKPPPFDKIPESSWIFDCGLDTDVTPIEEFHKIEAVTIWSRLSGSRGIFKAKNARVTCIYDIICGNDR